eukprot:403336483
MFRAQMPCFSFGALCFSKNTNFMATFGCGMVCPNFPTNVDPSLIGAHQITYNVKSFMMSNGDLLSYGESRSPILFPDFNLNVTDPTLGQNPCLTYLNRIDVYGNIVYVISFDVKQYCFSELDIDYVTRLALLSNDEKYLFALMQGYSWYASSGWGNHIIVLDTSTGGMQGQYTWADNLNINFYFLFPISVNEAYFIGVAGNPKYTLIGKIDFSQTIVSFQRYTFRVTNLPVGTLNTQVDVHKIQNSMYFLSRFNKMPLVLRYDLNQHKVFTSYYMILKESNTNLDQSTFSTVQTQKLNQNGQVMIQTGLYVDSANKRMGIGIRNSLLQFSGIGILNFNQTGTESISFKIIYNSQKGLLLQFNYFTFVTIDQGILSGYVLHKINPQYPIKGMKSIVVSIPEPYYFEMSTPYNFNFYILSESTFNISSNTLTFAYQSSLTTITLITKMTNPYYSQVMPAQIDQPSTTINRSLSLPTIPNRIIQYLGDEPQVVQFNDCIYNQTICEDTVYTNYVTMQDGTLLDTKFTYIEATNKLYIAKSTDLNVVGNYSMKFKCKVPDGFSNEKQFIIEYKYDGRNFTQPIANTTNNTSNVFNLAPMFYTNPRNIVVRAGGSAVLTLPDYFDPNDDEVTISAKYYGTYSGKFFKFLDKNRLQFDAGLKLLGDQVLVITLTDNNKYSNNQIQQQLSIFKISLNSMFNKYRQMAW